MHRMHGQTDRPADSAVRRSRSPSAGKLLVPLLGMLAVLAMGVAAVAIVLRIQEREKLQAKERELQLAFAENESLKTQLDDLQQQKAVLDETLTRIRQDLAASQQELAQTIEAREALARSVEDREQEIGRLTKELEQTQTQFQQVAAQVSGLQAERDAAQQQLTVLEQAKSQLETKVIELSGHPTVELDAVRVTSDGTKPQAGAGSVLAPVAAMPPTSGQVVVVNREYDFIVMNRGRNHGLAVGQEFHVVRGEDVLGTVKVEKVYDELSAAAILPDSRKNDIREGDAVKAL